MWLHYFRRALMDNPISTETQLQAVDELLKVGSKLIHPTLSGFGDFEFGFCMKFTL